ncbi:ThiF family adenylyltransferase (plasmid) [Ureibacillus chungkukjangi]|uniref:ThiF family adenylyltransferase n=1 Tax=Ureibacillus chungkukjangi TaxID=1202712 RepID=UPI000D39E508|nr:ThiF family adenylyltransferase [Ureibacillus chungkukjangi]MCM3390545.1 ThiF family adenylyltransferase [Ureibacillus chungkukjangi]
MNTTTTGEINLLKKIGHIYSNTSPFYEGVYPFIVQVGTGGNGGYVLQHLAQMLGTNGIPHTYVIADPDQIETKNLKNQLFLEEEVGLKKADVLAERYSAAYNIDIASYSEKFIESVEDLAKLFNTEYMRTSFGYSEKLQFLPILIGCVDNNYTRSIFDQYFNKIKKIIYIDAGNESTVCPTDWQTRPIQQWTEEELQVYKNSGWSGQVVCGVKLGDDYQPPISKAFPNDFHDVDSIKPSEMSCNELSASEPQRIIVNKFAALAVANYINQIIDDYSISTHITMFHAKKGYLRSYEYDPLEEDL